LTGSVCYSFYKKHKKGCDQRKKGR
jgi:hypothetical protein